MNVSIQQTKDYNSFKEVISNREVDKRHVKRLVEAIRENNMLHLNPIIVNDQLEVIDGQHRLQAAKELNKEIYYIVDCKVSKQNIAGLNSNKMNWKAIDYVNYYFVEKIPEYLVLSDFINRYPVVPVSTLVQLLHPNQDRDMRGFKEGKINVSGSAKADEILKLINQVRNLGIELAFDRNFILAIAKCFKLEAFKPEQFIEKLTNNRLELFKCAKKQQYLQVIEGIYNKHQQNRLRFY